MSKLDLSFEIIEDRYESMANVEYSTGCSETEVSACCTKVCSKGCKSDASLNQSAGDWERYLEINAGVLQY